MGLLFQGLLLSWEEIKCYVDYVWWYGIFQFLYIYYVVKDWYKDVFKWGDEVEYMLVFFDYENKKV